MGSSFLQMFSSSFVIIAFLASFINAQSSSDTDSGYTGYSLKLTGDDSVIYATADTPANESTTIPVPDVFLNASVFVGGIDITVDNLTAQANIGLEVLSLLKFNAGVDVSIQQVKLQISNVSAEVILEARLENLVTMVNDTLNAIDANPDIANLGEALGSAVNSTASSVSSAAGSLTSGVTGATSLLSSRSYEIDQGILYSTNDYTGDTHTNRILTQSGSIVDEVLDNEGYVSSTKVVGSYATEMTPNGYDQTVDVKGHSIREVEYVYTPYDGLSIVVAIYLDSSGNVIATHVLSDIAGGGSSTISSEEL